MLNKISLFGMVFVMLLLSGCPKEPPEEDIVLNAPNNVRAVSSTTYSIVLTWNEVKNADMYFIIEASSSGGLTSSSGKPMGPSYSTPYTRYEVTGLKKNTTYWFKVYAYNSKVGDGPVSSAVYAKTWDS
ncbi:MAG: fibronectin type III domain-containing protein [Treponema sp.]|jgi:hypothetical protein|nr:fibronectin type III domain-containing protein [Treponema sp.]